jgi:predicted acetyltransferase
VPGTVRAINDSEVAEYLGCLRTAFLGDREVTTEEADWRAKRMDLARTHCVFSDRTLCGTARTFPTELTVPGGFVDASALTEVSVLPTYRRQGHLNRMMAAQLDDAKSRSEPVSILTASEWGIYGRFGYGVATERVSIELRTIDVRFIDPTSGSVEMVGAHELRSLAPKIYDRARPSIVGALSRDDEWWDLLLDLEIRPGSSAPKNRCRVIWRDDQGTPQGYATYDTTESWSDGRPVCEIQIRELTAATPQAHRELWRYVCSIDLVAWVRANHRPIDDPLALELIDGRAIRTRAKYDHLWVRILDPQASLSHRNYSAPGRLVLEILDPLYEPSRRLAIEGGPGHGSAEPTSADPDIVLDIGALGTAYLGGFSFAALAAAGRLVERVPGSVALADAMFSVKPLPYLTTNF